MTLALAIVASLGLGVQQAPSTVQGVVRGADDGSPVIGAEIVLVGSGRSTVTDSSGRYVLQDVAGGDRRLRAHHLGFLPLEVDLSVPPAGVVAVDFHLRVRAFELQPIDATVAMMPVRTPPDAAAEEPAGLPARTVVRELGASPGVTEMGIAAGAKALLGPDPPAPDNVLYVRGAGAALDLVLLDGAPVHAPFHLGGLIDPGLPPAIERAERLHGGVTARYDGGLSDVLLLGSRAATEGTEASLFADMLAVGGAFRTAAADVGAVSASWRSLHGAGESGLLPTAFPQAYSDALVRADLFPADGADTLSLTLFRNQESVRIGEGPDGDQPRWGNTAGSLRYQTRTVLGWLELGGALGSFDTRLPVGATDPLVATGSTDRLRAWADFEHEVDGTRLGYGIQGDRLRLRTQFRSMAGAETDVRLRQRADAGAVALWAEGQRRLLADLDVTAGLRANLFTNDLGRSLSPRVRLGWDVSDDLRVTGSYGRFHQLVVAVDTELPIESTIVTAADGRVLGSVLSRVDAARSTHLVLGVRHAPRSRTVIRVEGYWKSSGGVPEFGEGTFRNTGIDVVVSRPIATGFTVWGAYTLGWAWAAYEDGETRSVYGGRHFLRGGLAFDAPGSVRFDADLSMGEGLEFGAVPRSERTPIPVNGAGDADAPAAVASGPVSAVPGGPLAFQGPTGPGGPVFTRVPDSSYLRLNVQATAELDVRLFGKDQRLLPYFRIVNALDRRDALFFHYDGDEGDEPRALGSVPILPVVGLEWRL